MNRTLPPLTSSQIVPSQDAQLSGNVTPGDISQLGDPGWFDRRELSFAVAEPATTPAYSCFAPMHYEAGYSYPLIVWLHGAQSNEDELPQVMPLISTRNFVAIAPRGTSYVQNIRGAYTWDDTTDSIAEAAERVEDCIQVARERFNIHADRIFVAGHSAGGTMALRLGLEHPERFAGAISLGGQVPRGSRLLKHVNRARNLPLLLSASPTEGVYSTDEVMQDLRFLHNAGMSLSLRMYPEGDELTTVMFKDLNSWVMEQFCPSSAATAS